MKEKEPGYRSLFFPFISANVCKQMMQKILLGKFRPHSTCKGRMRRITTNVTAKTRDDLIYTCAHGEIDIFKVVEVQPLEQQFMCKKFNISSKSFEKHPDLDFGTVGLFNWHGFHNIHYFVKAKDVKGKAFKFGSLISTIPTNVLLEK